MSASSIIRAGQRAYSATMRRLILTAAAFAAVALAVYRNRTIDRHEEELAIGRHAPGRPATER